MRKNFLKVATIGLCSFTLAGCAPSPPPPLLGGPVAFVIGWIIFGLAAFGVMSLWKKPKNKTPPKTEYVTNALNDVNNRLKNLEKKIERLKKEIKSQ